ncbi:MAG: hypothetical protein ACODAQ_12165 [Phycisphaeraceae bacterium]
MPTGKSTGLTKAQYQRWRNCGHPDLDAFKAAGCPTPTEWHKLQAGDGDTPTPTPPKRKKSTKRSRKKKVSGRSEETSLPAMREERLVAAEPLHSLQSTRTSSGTVRVRAIVIDAEMSGGDVAGLVDQLTRALRQ